MGKHKALRIHAFLLYSRGLLRLMWDSPSNEGTRGLCENKEPILEEENIKALLKGEENV